MPSRKLRIVSAGAIGSLLLVGCGHSAQKTAALPILCGANHLPMSSLAPGQKPEHLSEIAQSVAEGVYNGLVKVSSTTPVLMADPDAARDGLGSPTQVRLMWVIDSTEVIGTPGLGPAPKYPVNTIVRNLILVEDSTLRLGGIFICGATEPRM